MGKQRINEGAIVKIPLGGMVSYGQIVSKSEIAFFDGQYEDNSHENQGGVHDNEILFIVAVMNNVIKSGRWKIVGRELLREALKTSRDYFIQDKQKIFIYNSVTGKIRPGSKEEAEGLECAAAWDGAHVEDRLRDYYAGRPNVWVEQLKLK